MTNTIWRMLRTRRPLSLFFEFYFWMLSWFQTKPDPPNGRRFRDSCKHFSIRILNLIWHTRIVNSGRLWCSLKDTPWPHHFRKKLKKLGQRSFFKKRWSNHEKKQEFQKMIKSQTKILQVWDGQKSSLSVSLV